MTYTPDRWRQVEDLFERALGLAPEHRDGFLRGACQGDPVLREDIDSLLAADAAASDGADEVFERWSNAVQASATAAISTAAGRAIGRFRLVRELGRGGMGVVFLAERADGEFEQQVAIKLIQGVETNEAARRRFVTERQILARLDHPAIARLLDGGTTEEGQPYLVMEYVDGKPIDHWCEELGLGVESRLRLVRKVCEAVESAHRRSIVHRDLKPSNILVTHDGLPKLLDFGIAKLLREPNAPGESEATITLVSRRALTPEYASPEQVRGGPIAAASDVYSLGLLLYRLLTGVSGQPWPTEGDDLEEVVCRREPPPPSVAVQRREAATGARPAEGSPRPASGEVARQLAGDLDQIVLKAIRKEPHERYASARDLADDIGRWLAGRSVTARRGILRYRGIRLVRRHPALTTALVSALAAIGLFVLSENLGRPDRSVVSTTAAPSAIAGENGAASTRRSAAVLAFENLSGAEESAWLGRALSELLASELAAGEELRVVPGREVAQRQIDSNLGLEGAPTSADIRLLTGRLGVDIVLLGHFLRIGAGPTADLRVDCRLASDAGATLVQFSETGTEAELFDLVARLGARLREGLGVGALSLSEQDELSAARPDNPQAARRYASGLEAMRRLDLQRARDFLGEAVAADPSFALAHSALADVWSELGFDGRAVEASTRAFELAADLPRADRLEVEAQFHEAQKDWSQAIEVHRTRTSLFPDDPEAVLALAGVQTAGGQGEDALRTLADFAARQPEAAGDPRLALSEAEAAGSRSDFERQRDAARRAAEAGRRQGFALMVARSRLSEWWALRNLGELDGAAAAAEEARRLFARAGDRGGVARALNAQATLLADRGRLDEATKIDLEALEVFRQIGDRRRMSWSLNNLGRNLRSRGDLAGARRAYAESLEISREIDDPSGTARAQANLGRLLLESGDLAAAEELHLDSLRLRREIGEVRGIAGAILDLGVVLLARGELTQALERIEEAVDSFLEVGDKQSAAHALGFLGECRLARGELEWARAAVERSLALRDELGATRDVARSRLQLARLALAANRPAEAAELLVDLLSAESRPLLGSNAATAEALLAETRWQLGDGSGARAALEAARRSSDRPVALGDRLDLEILLARSMARFGEDSSVDAALEALESLEAEADAARLAQPLLEARLAAAEIALAGGDPAAPGTVEAFATEAAKAGYQHLAQRARSLRPPS